MRKLTNLLIGIFVILDLILIFKTRTISYTLICLSFVVIMLFPKICRIFKMGFSVFLEFSFVLFVILAQFFGSILNFYDKIYWYDSFTHFLSGILSALFAFVILSKLKVNSKSVLFNIIFMISFTMLVASLWEVFEFISNSIFKTDPQKVLTTGVTDTMKDMICAFFGSLIFSIMYLYDYVKRKKIFNKLFN